MRYVWALTLASFVLSTRAIACDFSKLSLREAKDEIQRVYEFPMSDRELDTQLERTLGGLIKGGTASYGILPGFKGIRRAYWFRGLTPKQKVQIDAVLASYANYEVPKFRRWKGADFDLAVTELGRQIPRDLLGTLVRYSLDTDLGDLAASNLSHAEKIAQVLWHLRFNGDKVEQFLAGVLDRNPNAHASVAALRKVFGMPVDKKAPAPPVRPSDLGNERKLAQLNRGLMNFLRMHSPRVGHEEAALNFFALALGAVAGEKGEATRARARAIRNHLDLRADLATGLSEAAHADWLTPGEWKKINAYAKKFLDD